jgi:hypothetical protein
LSRIENYSPQGINALADLIPQEWYGDADDLQRLIEQLIARRGRVRELIDSFRTSTRQPFPNWGRARAAGAS